MFIIIITAIEIFAAYSIHFSIITLICDNGIMMIIKWFELSCFVFCFFFFYSFSLCNWRVGSEVCT
jgi:hypothetical protein